MFQMFPCCVVHRSVAKIFNKVVWNTWSANINSKLCCDVFVLFTFLWKQRSLEHICYSHLLTLSLCYEIWVFFWHFRSSFSKTRLYSSLCFFFKYCFRFVGFLPLTLHNIPSSFFKQQILSFFSSLNSKVSYTGLALGLPDAMLHYMITLPIKMNGNVQKCSCNLYTPNVHECNCSTQNNYTNVQCT